VPLRYGANVTLASVEVTAYVGVVEQLDPAMGDRDFFVRLYRTTSLFGGRVDRGSKRRFLAGGWLADALLLAMLTAEPPT